MTLMGIGMFIMSTVEDEKYGFTPYFKELLYYGAPLLDLQYTTSIFALIFGPLGILAIHHWASIISNRELFTKLSKGYQVVLVFMTAFSTWQMSIFFKVFEGADFESEYYMQELYIAYLFTIIIMLPFIGAAIMYGLNINFLQEKVDEGGELEEPPPLPPHAMDLTDVNVADIAGLALLVPALIISQIYDFFVEIYEMVAKCYRNYKENRRRAAVQNKSFMRRFKKTVNRVLATAFGCRRKDDWEMGYNNPERISAEEEAEMRARQAEENAEHAAAERAAREEASRLEALAADSAARELAEAKFVNVIQFRDLWNSLPPAGSFQCNVKERPVMKKLVDHMSTRGFHVVFASNTSTNPEDTEHTSADFEMGICNVRGADVAEYGRSFQSPKKSRAIAADSRAELAEGLGQVHTTGGDKYASDQPHFWFLARFRCTPTAFSAVMKSEDPSAVTRYVKRFALAKVLKVDTSSA